MTPICRLHSLFIALLISFAVLQAHSIQADPQSARDLYLKSLELYQQKKYTQALKQSRAAEQADPQNGRFAAHTGRLLFRVKKYAEALDAFSRADQRHYNKPWTGLYRSYSYLKLKQYKQALNYAQRTMVAAEQKKQVAKSQKNRERYQKQATSVCGIAAAANYKLDRWTDTIAVAQKCYRMTPTVDNHLLRNAQWKALTWQAHSALAGGDYRDATIAYQNAAAAYQKNRKVAANDLSLTRIRHFMALAEELHKSAKRKPLYVHRILGLFIDKTDVHFIGPWSGEVRVKNRMRPRHFARQKLIQGVFKRWLEAASQGHFSVTFENHRVDATLKNIDAYIAQLMVDKYECHRPLLDSIDPYPVDLIYNNINEFDTIIFYWNGENGLATSAHGGAKNIPIVPYQTYSERRGRLILPANWTDNPVMTGILSPLHEYFHTIEMLTNIRPLHGFWPQHRKHFPKWKGSGQLDYYLWHFRTTLPHLPSKQNQNIWQSLNYRHRLPNRMTLSNLALNRKTIKRVAPENRLRAHRLLQQAEKKIKKGQVDTGLELLKKAQQIHPYHQQILQKLAFYSYKKRDYKKAKTYYAALAEYHPGATNHYYMGSLLQWQEKQPEKAIPWYRKLIKQYPKYKHAPRAHRYLGRALIQLERYNEAATSLQSCRQLPSSQAAEEIHRCTYWLGYLYTEKLDKKTDGTKLICAAYNNGFQTSFTRRYYKKYCNP